MIKGSIDDPWEWRNLIACVHALHNTPMVYVNVINAITTFVEPTPPTNIITNLTILNQYIIKKGLQIFGKKVKLRCKNNCNNFMTTELLNQIGLAISLINKVRIAWRT